jgi:hypothetical protein
MRRKTPKFTMPDVVKKSSTEAASSVSMEGSGGGKRKKEWAWVKKLVDR